jgi:hypothetical protein
MSAWISGVVEIHIKVQQLKMEYQLILDYGPRVAITEVLLPHTAASSSDDVPMNWTVPHADFECTRPNK